MFESLTAGALRALSRSELRAHVRGASHIEPLDLVAALLDEEESRAAALLVDFGLDPGRFFDTLRLVRDLSESRPSESVPHHESTRSLISKAVNRARAFDRSQSVGTDHLLSAVLEHDLEMVDRLVDSGLDVPALQAYLDEAEKEKTAPIPMESDIGPLELSEPGEGIHLGRILDASGNRAREGLRVVEDYVRFALDDPALTRRTKEVRHRLGEALRGLDAELLVGSRDTRGDVGTHIMTASESTRENPRAVLTANFKRAGEALRTLEEYSKLINVWVSGRFEVLRYDVYTLEKLVMTAVTATKALGEAKLMVLVGGLPTMGDLTWVVGEALAGGADVIQTREKGIDDREWLRRAREVRILTAQAGARFLVNDRPDLARLAGADGVHLGQEDLSVRDARRIIGPTAIIGVSTHNAEQLDRAILDAASYLGVGPVFESGTKDFEQFAGMGFIRRAAETSKLPWFAIGGIDASNIDQVIEAGAQRVAVSGAVVRADSPRKAAALLRARLDQAE